MAVIENLDVNLRGNTSELDNALSKAQKGVSSLSGMVGKSLSGLFASLSFGNLGAFTSQIQSLFGGVGTAAKFGLASIKTAVGGIVTTVSSLGKIGGSAVGGIAKMFTGTEGAMSSFGSMGGSALSALGGVGAALGGTLLAAGAAVGVFVAALAGIAVIANQSMGALQGVGKSAQVFGISTQAMGGLEVASARAGMGTDELEHSMMHLQKTISEAANGSAEANAILNKLNVTADELSSVPLDQAFRKVGVAIQKTGTQADKTSNTLKVFGRGAFDLAKMITGEGDFGEKLDKAKQDAIDMGLGVTQAQTDAARRVGAAWKGVSLAFSGVGRSLAVMLTPAFEAVANAAQAISSWLAKAVVSAMPYWNAFAETIKVVWDAIVATVGPIITGLFNSLSSQLDQWGISFGSVKDLFLKGLFAIQFGAQNMGNVFTLVLDSILLKIVQLTNAITHAFGTTIPEVFKAMKDLVAGALSGDQDAVQAYVDRIDKAFTRPVGNLEARLAKQIADLKGGLGGFDEFIKKKMAEFNNRAAQKALEITPDQGKGDDNVSKRPAAVEAGSKEAFSILQNTLGKKDGDKMFAVANKQLDENKKIRAAVEAAAKALAGKVVVAKAGL